MSSLARRPLKSRQTAWAKMLAQILLAKKVHPNHVSIASVFFASLASSFLILTGCGEPGVATMLFYLGAAACIQLRLLCNMLDGLLAVEGGLKTRLGDLYNEIPDRAADTMILVGAGYSISSFDFGIALGWAGALFAVLTAYLRLLGVSLGTKAYFNGPQAKPHRMALLTVGCILAAFLVSSKKDHHTIALSLTLIVIGSVATCIRRLNFITAELHQS